ncbi:hypothetical protein [Enterococcus thailandicus]|uniref:hypothetical protein n=1 Tax=Enterococcus thailandicus TaxID=417368 RepID=UPI002891F8E5|nr:hypothetical protein [Enterococcus thailandicus]MDT2751907.1 hypothetical protein [Enterococcus thailandicus]MDT2776048.1 hypothetical protein [Enterococcus thailandicus]
MSIKISSSIEEVKNWITEEEVFDLLVSFGIVDDEYTYNKNNDILLPVEKNKTNNSKNDSKVKMLFEDIEAEEKNNNSFYFTKLGINTEIYSEAAA